jgi:hypothetical protein
MVLPDRIELSTSPLPMECSTTELRQHARELKESATWPLYRRGGSCHKGTSGASTRRGSGNAKTAKNQYGALAASSIRSTPGRSGSRFPAGTASRLERPDHDPKARQGAASWLPLTRLLRQRKLPKICTAGAQHQQHRRAPGNRRLCGGRTSHHMIWQARGQHVAVGGGDEARRQPSGIPYSNGQCRCFGHCSIFRISQDIRTGPA